MTLTITVGILAGIMGFIFLLLLIPIRIVATVSLKWREKDLKGTSRVLMGSKTFGLGLEFLPHRRLALGPHDHPWMNLPLFARNKTTRKKPGTDRKKKRPKRQYYPFIKMSQAGISVLNWEYLAIKGRLELKNPMYTGLIVGALNWISRTVPCPQMVLAVKPYFSNHQNTDLKGQIRFRVQPGRLAWHVGTAYFKYRK